MQRGKIYWLVRNFIVAFLSFTRRKPLISFLCLALCSLFIFISRAYIQPFVVLGRRFIFLEVMAVIVLLVWWRLFRNSGWKKKIVHALMFIFIGVGIYYAKLEPYNYMTLYLKYNSLNIEELSSLPLTDHERIHPQNSIKTLAQEAISETETFNNPDYVRVGDSYRWTMAVEPQYFYQKILESVQEVISVSGLAPAPNFSGDNRRRVFFDVSENLKFGRNTRTAVTKRFGPLQFLSYQPSDVKYVTNDKGEWIQVVTLVRWDGIFFPTPSFGGVYIIRQGHYDMKDTVIRAFFGAGDFVAPEDFEKHPYLRKQNILPYEVSRFTANSFRFQNGFLAPMPGYHKGDIRIPDLKEDINDQPFTTYFDFSGISPEMSMLYHYFGLEPFDYSKQGLNTSLFIPADGTDRVYVYKHFERMESLTGVSAVAAKVIESRKEYDWSISKPVEHRPFIRELQGQKRFFWLTTVVTFKNQVANGKEAQSVSSGKNGEFFAGSVPDLIITDAIYKKPVWVDASDPKNWESELE